MSGCTAATTSSGSTATRATTATTISTPIPNCESWKTRIDAIAEKAQKTFVVANNHFEGKAAVNALQLKHMVSGRSVRMPDMLLEKYWELGEIVARNSGAEQPK